MIAFNILTVIMIAFNILTVILFGVLAYTLHFKTDHDLLSIKLYQKKQEKIKEKGLDYEDFMKIYWNIIKICKVSFLVISISFLVGIFI